LRCLWLPNSLLTVIDDETRDSLIIHTFE